jgi:hypothetical protein
MAVTSESDGGVVAVEPPPTSSLLARKKLLRAAGGVLFVIAAVGLFLTIWTAQPPERGVIAEWNDTIVRLGIEPVFPPEEDIYVGDVLAVITVDRRPNGKDARNQPLLNRAIKLAHIDLSAALDAAYKELPRFPDTDKRPVSPQDPWPQEQKTASIFSGPPYHGSLARAAFPGFTINRGRGASGGLSSFLGGLLSGSTEESEVIEVKIPTAETYGLPSLTAAGQLTLYCQDPFTANVCTDDTLRRHLGYVTPDMWLTGIDPDTGRLRYLVDVEIALVNRVYLTRSIEQTRRLGRSQAAALKAVSEVAGHIKDATPAAGGTVTADDAKLAAVRKQAKELLDQLGTSVPGGLASVYSSSDSTFELKQTFQRPIVIGYRAVRRSFDYNLDRQNLAPQQQKTTGGESK